METEKTVKFTESQLRDIYKCVVAAADQLQDLNLSIAKKKLQKAITDIYQISKDQNLNLNKTRRKNV